ncbi:MAG: NADH-quinone oxidoreductase subunit K, partial [Anaerolineales bacterium]|nr:NADH-quinone oxidoreductase subunit K [Anaerolineales bacterium]
WRYRTLIDANAPQSSGLAWAIFVLTVAAAEAAVGLALAISIYRRRDSVVAEELSTLRN